MEDLEVSENVRIIDSALTRHDNIKSLTTLEASGSDNLLDFVHMEKDHEQLNLDEVIVREFLSSL